MKRVGIITKHAATVSELEKAWKSVSKNRLVRKDFADMPSGAYLKDRIPGGKSGAITIPSSTGAALPAKSKNLSNKFFIKGNSGTVFKNVRKAKGVKPIAFDGETHRGLNATINNHEGDEMKQFAKKNNPQTLAGSKFGHHSMAKILGPESNRLATASDASVKKGGKTLAEFREASGEKKLFDRYALKTKDGKQPYTYGDGNRTSRAYRKAMYKKEFGLPLDTTKGGMKKAIQKTREL